MKIVNIIGGLGNQMFQYSFALSLQSHFPNEEILIDTSHYNYLFIKKWGAANLHNGFEIDHIFPHAPLTKGKAKQLLKVTRYIPNYALSRLARRVLPPKKTEYIQSVDSYFEYTPEVYEIEGNCYYEGIWASAKFIEPIKDLITEAFTHAAPDGANSRYVEHMKTTRSVGIHVRRGDYLQSPSFKGICDIDYYRLAVEKILEDGLGHSFFVFSNDHKWCEENIKPMVGAENYVAITGNNGDNSHWDMFLMQHCKDLIIANSSFSWWGAFLNKRGGRIISPKTWVNRDAVFDIWLPDWIRL